MQAPSDYYALIVYRHLLHFTRTCKQNTIQVSAAYKHIALAAFIVTFNNRLINVEKLHYNRTAYDINE